VGLAGRAGELVSEQPGSEFPRAIGKVANRELVANGYTTYDSLTKVSAKTLLKIHGVGPKAVRILGEELAAQGKAYAAD
jgi:predicted flap endonuclease-1-like 5' DNA nuclease